MTSLEVAASVALFIATWLFTGFVVSLAGGWHALAELYRTEGPPPVNVRRMQSARLRALMHYNNAVTSGADGRGLYLAMLPIFRVGHPSLLIPWSEIEVQLRQRAFGKGIRFVFTQVPGVYLEVSEKLGQQLLQAAGLASRSLPQRAMGEFERRNEECHSLAFSPPQRGEGAEGG